MNRFRKSAAAALSIGLGLAAGPAAADALMGKTPWAPRDGQVSRASVAALQMQYDHNKDALAALGSASSFACGGGGTATATANYTCVIVNDSDAVVNTGQESTGNQNAESNSAVTANGVPQESMSDVLESMQ